MEVNTIRIFSWPSTLWKVFSYSNCTFPTSWISVLGVLYRKAGWGSTFLAIVISSFIYILYLFQIVGWKCYLCLWSLYAHTAGCIKNCTVPKMFTKLQIPQNLWKLYGSMGSLVSASIFTTKIILKSKFPSAGNFRGLFL